jgi:aminoglycoside phosphotransferase family enzyme/predicted kinase
MSAPERDLERLVAALCDPARWAQRHESIGGIGDDGRVERLETHISYVLLAGERAYKLKKPLDLGFLDFSTLAKRHAACLEELRLNRRTAPELYLGVLPIGGTPDEPVPGALPALEFAVEMRRFDQEALAERVVARGELTPPRVEALAHTLAAFHARVTVSSAADGFGTPAATLAPALENFEQLAPLVTDAREQAALAELRAWTEREGARLAPTFAERKRAGRVRECHGDQHHGNLVLLEGRWVLFDALEFSAALRWIDVMNEVAFLDMDLADHGHEADARALLDAYLAESGDYAGLDVLPFYLVYRAMVRAKVAAIRGHQAGDHHGRARADQESEGYVRLAAQLAEPRPRALIAMHGLSGSGKSFLAAELVRRTGAARLRSDVERKRLAGLAAEARSGSELDAGLYAADATRATYARLRELAGIVLHAGFPVIVDATFLARSERDAVRALARERGVRFQLVACAADPAVLRRRVAERAARGADPSEATVEVLERQLARAEPLGEDERADTVVVDTGAEAPPEVALAPVLRALERGG